MHKLTFPDFVTIIEKQDPFTSRDGQGCIRLFIDSPRGYAIFPLRSRAFKEWFFNECYLRYNALPNPQAFATFLTFLDARGKLGFEGRFCGVSVGRRVTFDVSRTKILLDLSDRKSRFVEISPGSWKIATSEDAFLQTSRSTMAFPEPIPTDPNAPSPLDALRACLNLPSRSAWLRVLAWILAALRPQGPYPFLILQGPPAAGKSFATRVLRAILDPCTSLITPTPVTRNDLFTAVRDNWVLAFHNVSAFPPPVTQALCLLSSGLGVAFHENGRREVEPVQQVYRRPVLLSVTEDFECPAAIAERALIVDLPRIPPHSRRSEDSLGDIFGLAWPAILGALCTALATALERMPRQTPPTGRCADALAWAVAASPALGCTEDEMRQAFDPPPPPHPMVEAVRNLLDQRQKWTGSATELHDLLGPALSCATPTVVSHQLRTCMLTLADYGIELKFRRLHEGARIIDLSQDLGDALSEKDPECASPDFSQSPQPTETEEVTR